MRFNEGRTGVPLEKLERIATETRKFLDSIASDLDLPQDIRWLGSKFQNRSVSYEVEGDSSVEIQQAASFNSAVEMMSRGEIPPFITRESAGKFFGISKAVGPDERVRFGLYNGSVRPHWVDLRPGITPQVAPIIGTIQYVGAVQGTLHSWFRQANPPYFYLRDSVSHNLVRCEYHSDSVYNQLAQAVSIKEGVIHAHGRVTADRLRRSIEGIDVDKLAWVKPFSMRDLDEYLDDSEKIQ
jgi:hypothetical protein